MRQKLTAFLSSYPGLILVGAVLGLVAATLQYLGNPPNMGICVACFERDLAGALGLHRAAVVQYLRPEIPALLLGSTLAAFAFGEFRARASAAPVVRFVLGGFAMIGALVFLGCPWRALFRLGGGDLNAVVGILGLVAGLILGRWFIRRGFELGAPKPAPAASGLLMPVMMVGLLILSFLEPDFILRSTKGPGAMAVSVGISIAAGLVVGFLAQRSRFCTVGAFRNAIFARDGHLLSGVLSVVVVVFVANLAYGQVRFGLEAQPAAHSAWLWNLLGMVLAGLAFELAGGCPGRQLVLAGEGSGDSGVFVLGMIAGAGIAHNFLLTARPDKLVEGAVVTGGPGLSGQVAVIIGLATCAILGFAMREK